MAEFKLRYGDGQIELDESTTLIGIRPRQNRDEAATLALRGALDGGEWRDAGVLGGFRIVSIEGAAVSAGEALDRVRSDAAIQVGTHVFEAPEGRGVFVPTGEVFVRFKPGTPAETSQKTLDDLSLEIKESRGPETFVVRVTPGSPNPVKVAAALQANPDVALAEPDLAAKAAVKAPALQVDALLGEQWHLRNTGFHRNTGVGFKAGADARVIDAWSEARTMGQAAIIVAVIDDGFDLKHPDFSAAGKVVHPWDFSRRTNDPAPGDGDWHGTACSGVAVAAAGGGGVVGAAPGCTLMPVRWGPSLSDGQIEAWFEYVNTKGAAVVSCSWGAANPYFPLSTRARDAITKCATEGRSGKGCVIVFAAGNDNRNVNDPASHTIDGFATHPNVIAVAASTSRDLRSNYSNFGNEIALCAPSSGAGGWGILTSDVTGYNSSTGAILGYADGDYTYDFGGTSSACPLVAGIAALVLSVDPTLTSAEVKTLLQRTCRKIGAASEYDAGGHSSKFGYGCVDALAAVQQVSANAQPSVARAMAEATPTTRVAKPVTKKKSVS
ncbi:MAG: S8 family serine peptidase [Terricaulis sp.]